ncbi:MAG TPA: ribosomal protein S18-alanine N-acetyltransferase [Terriglobales bacterium]|nr:ribosomal protein S18-alanine N-acetyltransferase [Terriglobales bacterium]
MKIRSAVPADIHSMMALQKHAATAAHWPVEQYESLFAASGVRRLALVIEEDGVLQGFLMARSSGSEWEIENIAVTGPARRRGLGTRLLGEFLDLARREGAQSVFLEVRESNRAARALYEKWAFVESGHRKGYYRDPQEDAVTYQLLFG